VLDADWVLAGAQPQPGQHYVRQAFNNIKQRYADIDQGKI